MLEVNEILKELERLGSEQTKKIYLNHGSKEPLFGVKVGDLKSIVKRVKKNYPLALALYATGNCDAMYLAGLIADETQMSKADLQQWVQAAYCYMLSDFAVAAVASESPHGWQLGLEWIESTAEMTASAGWSTLAAWISIRPDEQIDMEMLKQLLQRVQNSIHQAPNRARYAMNHFVIAVGTFVLPLNQEAKTVATAIGKVNVTMGKTACQVPIASEYIAKVEQMGRSGKKRKIARC